MVIRSLSRMSCIWCWIGIAAAAAAQPTRTTPAYERMKSFLDAIPAIVDKAHAHTALERFPGFWAVFGFVGCVVLIIVSKWFGHTGIMTREDYYDE